jgi:DNA-binding transcriptional ArsR family regulator
MPAEHDVLALFRRAQPLLSALGDERRQELVILMLNAGTALSVGEIAAQMNLSQPAISHHLKILRGAGLFSVQRVGTSRLYALDIGPDVLAPLTEMVQGIQECLASAEPEPAVAVTGPNRRTRASARSR